MPVFAVQWAMRLYRWLLRLYPTAFRERYGHEMAQVFSDECRARWRQHPPNGLLAWWVHTLLDLAVTASSEHLAQFRRQKMAYLRHTVFLGLLILTWVILFFTLAFFAQLILAPWDTALTQPALGTWQRTLNDFFESGGGGVLALPVILTSVGFALRTINRHSGALAAFIVSNALFFVGLIALFGIACTINNTILWPYPPVLYDPNYEGYHRSVFPLLVIGAACAIWLRYQRRIQKNRSATLAV
ncbi:MAG TPA: hypothetical protein VHO69_04570 [Phototrophicaceae bacterium]|nr:hypothetical protein [Phototrophicaceae bacterium]